jgi:hypothetical protein
MPVEAPVTRIDLVAVVALRFSAGEPPGFRVAI